MSSPLVQPVILAGGSGTRLWPLSTTEFPKQFRPLLGKRSTFQDTLSRVTSSALYKAPITITNQTHAQLAQEQQAEIGVAGILIAETARRDSAAAVALAALAAQRDDPQALVLTLAADHVIPDAEEFRRTVQAGCAAAASGKIVVFGLTPAEPKTCYGYIQPGAALDESGKVSDVNSFVEKPDLETALGYFQSGYLWNSGNFLFRADVMIEAFHKFAPEIIRSVQDSFENATELPKGIFNLDAERFEKTPADSIDYAIIERTDNCAVVKGDFIWSDVGSWDAVWEILPKDAEQNSHVGQAHFIESQGCFIHSEGRPTVAVGLNDIIVVSTDDAVLVLPKDKTQQVKKVAQLLGS